MKLWHDDVRPAPDDWIWVRTNEGARRHLEDGQISMISLDHDLGADLTDGIYAKGTSEETGMQLVEWMIQNDLVPTLVIIHSWNIPAARRMQQAFMDAGYTQARLRPFHTEEII